jgi:hypothetical protein
VSAHAAILALLQASADLVALVDTRIFPDVMDDPPVYPSVTFQKTGGGGARRALANPGLSRASFQVSTWSRSRAEAVRIARAVRTALDRKRKVTAGGVAIDDCFYESDVDSYDSETGVAFNHMDFTIHYREPS